MFEIERFQNRQEKQIEVKKIVAVYCRVSSRDQKKNGDLDRQIRVVLEHCKNKELENPLVFRDVGSGLNTKRRGLRKLCSLVEAGSVSRVVLTYPDRLTRFGFDYLERYFKSLGTTIHAINKKISGTMEEELVQDMIAIITSFFDFI